MWHVNTIACGAVRSKATPFPTPTGFRRLHSRTSVPFGTVHNPLVFNSTASDLQDLVDDTQLWSPHTGVVWKRGGSPKILKLRYLPKQTSTIYTYLRVFGGMGLRDTWNFNLPINKNNRKAWNDKKQRHQGVWERFVINRNNKWVVRKNESLKDKGKDKHGKR